MAEYGTVVIPVALPPGTTYYFAPGASSGRIPVFSRGMLIGYLIEWLLVNPGAIQDLVEGPPTFYLDGQLIIVNRVSGEIRVIRLQADADEAENADEGEDAELSEYDQWVADHGFDPDWEPPPKNYCGEDINEYYTLLFLIESIASFGLDPASQPNFEKSILLSDIRKYEDKAQNIEARLAKKGCYARAFGDYARLRARYWQKSGAMNEWVWTNITLNTTTAEAYNLAQQSVSQWW